MLPLRELPIVCDFGRFTSCRAMAVVMTAVGAVVEGVGAGGQERHVSVLRRRLTHTAWLSGVGRLRHCAHICSMPRHSLRQSSAGLETADHFRNRRRAGRGAKLQHPSLPKNSFSVGDRVNLDCDVFSICRRGRDWTHQRDTETFIDRAWR